MKQSLEGVQSSGTPVTQSEPETLEPRLLATLGTLIDAAEVLESALHVVRGPGLQAVGKPANADEDTPSLLQVGTWLREHAQRVLSLANALRGHLR